MFYDCNYFFDLFIIKIIIYNKRILLIILYLKTLKIIIIKFLFWNRKKYKKMSEKTRREELEIFTEDFQERLRKSYE